MKAGRNTLSSVKDEELPDDLRRMSPSERQTHVDRQATERTTLNNRMTDLVKKRDAYVAEQRKNGARARGRLVRPGGGEDTADADCEVM